MKTTISYVLMTMIMFSAVAQDTGSEIGETDSTRVEEKISEEELMPGQVAVDDTVLTSVNDSLNLLEWIVVGDDTLPIVKLKPVSVVAFKDYVSEYQYKRLKRNVTKVYPYAIQAAGIITEIEEITGDIEKKRKKKKYLKGLEKELRDSFESELKNLTISQGKILTKLLSRETGSTTHALLTKYKSGVSAALWNTLGKRFGYDIKKMYDPINDPEDKSIERIIQEIELGA